MLLPTRTVPGALGPAETQRPARRTQVVIEGFPKLHRPALGGPEQGQVGVEDLAPRWRRGCYPESSLCVAPGALPPRQQGRHPCVRCIVGALLPCLATHSVAPLRCHAISGHRCAQQYRLFIFAGHEDAPSQPFRRPVHDPNLALLPHGPRPMCPAMTQRQRHRHCAEGGGGGGAGGAGDTTPPLSQNGRRWKQKRRRKNTKHKTIRALKLGCALGAPSSSHRVNLNCVR